LLLLLLPTLLLLLRCFAHFAACRADPRIGATTGDNESVAVVVLLLLMIEVVGIVERERGMGQQVGCLQQEGCTTASSPCRQNSRYLLQRGQVVAANSRLRGKTRRVTCDIARISRQIQHSQSC
jgi:hypothetical protein